MKVITKSLKGNNAFAVILLLMGTGCATSGYRIANQSGGQYELLTTSDRVLITCENLQADDMESYGFSVFVLDENNTVLPILQTNRLGESDCSERLRKIGKILKGSKQVYIAGIGDLEKPIKLREPKYFFPKHGTFMDNGRHLQFHAIANDRGECFDAYSGSKKPCPQGHFPLKPSN